VEHDAVAAIVDGMRSPHFRARYVHTQGVCLPHFEMAHAVCRDAETWRLLYDTQTAGVNELLGELNELIRKQDYRFSNEGIGPEFDSCRRAVERVRGRSR
jgi:hypothetical protein